MIQRAYKTELDLNNEQLTACKRHAGAARWAGVYVGRLAVRATGSRNIMTARETVQGIHWTYRQPLQRGDGYNYTKGAVLPPQA
jgi:hypothetical protein